MDPLDVFSLARKFEINNLPHKAIECYKAVITSSKDELLELDSILRLAFIYKRNLNWDEAVNLWHGCLEYNIRHAASAYEELAKYYEHRERNYDKALELVEQALSRLEKEVSTDERIVAAPWKTLDWHEMKSAFEYRVARLRSKINKF